MLKLSDKDKMRVKSADEAMKKAIRLADNPVAVAKKIAVQATSKRNKGRKAARRKYPFAGICEVSGLPISESIAALDEIEPERGYEEGLVRWVCQRANNSGTGSCGSC